MQTTHNHDITVAIHDRAWNSQIANPTDTINTLCLTTFTYLQDKLPHGTLCFAVVCSNSHEVQQLNQQFRGKDAPTNVLSFCADTSDQPMPDDGETMLGDIILAYEVIQEEALEQDKPFTHHFSHMVVHGLLHLLGYDHMNETDAETMETIERHILALLHIPDPYNILVNDSFASQPVS